MSVLEISIGDVARTLRGVTYEKHDARSALEPDYVPLLRATNIELGGLTFDNLVYVPATVVNDDQRLRAGDIVLAASSGSLSVVGKAALFRGDRDITFGAFCYAVRADQRTLLPEYLAYFMSTPEYRGGISKLAAGVNINNLRREHIEGFRMPLVGLDGQRRIIDALDSYLSRLDAAVATLQAAQAKLKAYRASVLKAAVEGRLVPTEAALARAEKRDFEPADVLLKRILSERRRRWEEAELAKLKSAGKSPRNDKWKAKYEEPKAPDTKDLPKLPEGWCWASVEHLSVLVTDGDHNPPTRVPSGIPHLTAKNIKNNRVVIAGCSFVTEQGFEQTKQRYEPLAGDIIVTCVGTLGETAVVPPGIVFSADRNLAAIRLVPNGMLASFALHWLNTIWVQQHLGIVSGSTAQPHLYLGDLRALPVPLPPRAEQRRICAEVERLLSAREAVTGQVASDSLRCIRLRQAILKWAFEGKLVDQDPNDEPAEKLLERIRAERTGASGVAPKRRSPRRAASP